MPYPIETRIASKKGWDTPAEAKAFWGVYTREGVAIHWWNTPELAGTHDGTVDYELAQAAKGIKSANYILSDGKITMLVAPENVAFCTYEWNPRTVSIEIDPRITDEGYKKLGWLVAELRKQFGDMWVKGHNTLRPGTTQCPGNLDIARIVKESKQGEDMPTKSDLITGRIIEALVRGNNGLNGTKDALAGQMDDEITQKYADWDLRDYLVNAYESEQGKQYLKALRDGSIGSSATLLKPGTYKVN